VESLFSNKHAYPLNKKNVQSNHLGHELSPLWPIFTLYNFSPLYLSYTPLWNLRSSSGEYGGLVTTNMPYIRYLYWQQDRAATIWEIMYFPFFKFSKLNQNKQVPWKLKKSIL